MGFSSAKMYSNQNREDRDGMAAQTATTTNNEVGARSSHTHVVASHSDYNQDYSTAGYSVASQLYDELCKPNPCNNGSSCFLMEDTPHCSCPDTARSVPAGETCPPPEEPFSSLDAIHFVGIALVGMIIVAGILLRKRPAAPPPPKSKREMFQEHRSSIYDSDSEYESARGLAELYDKEEEEQLIQSTDPTTTDTPRKWKAQVLIIFSVTLWASNNGMIKDMVTIVPVGIAMLFRFLFPALVTLPRLICYRHDENDDSRYSWNLLLRGMETGIYAGLGLICQALALRTVPVPVQAFITGTSVVLVPFFDVLIDLPVLGYQWVAAIVALCGVAILTIPGEFAAAEPANVGDTVLAVVVPFAVALNVWRMGHAKNMYPHRSFSLTAAQMQGILILCIVYFLISERLSDIATYPWNEWLTDLQLWFYFIWTGLVTALAANAFTNYALGTLQSSEAILLGSTEPIFATVFAVIFYGANLGWELFVGGVVVIAACVFAAMAQREREKPP